MRVAAILAIYNTIIESLKGTIASTETSSGYYGNAIGATCALWLYGWGYYVYHGKFYFSYFSLYLVNNNRRHLL